MRYLLFFVFQAIAFSAFAQKIDLHTYLGSRISNNGVGNNLGLSLDYKFNSTIGLGIDYHQQNTHQDIRLIDREIDPGKRLILRLISIALLDSRYKNPEEQYKRYKQNVKNLELHITWTPSKYIRITLGPGIQRVETITPQYADNSNTREPLYGGGYFDELGFDPYTVFNLNSSIGIFVPISKRLDIGASMASHFKLMDTAHGYEKNGATGTTSHLQFGFIFHL